jgi:acetyltransferase-like isoleucine patch superfamily enzyme
MSIEPRFLYKNLRHRLKLALTNARVAARHDVLIEKAVTIKYPDALRFGRHVTLQSGSYLYGSRAGRELFLGDFVVLGSCSMVLGEGGVSVGASTHLGPHVVVTSQYGDSQSDMTAPTATLRTAPVTIGEGCWIGSGAVIMPGATLGRRCIVSPGSVVYGRWGDDVTLSGQPARPVANRWKAVPSRGAA